MPRQLNILSPLRNQRGATLMVVLMMVVILGLAAGMAGSSWRTIMQRVKEEELLFRGDQYRRAIESYATWGQVRPGAGGNPNQTGTVRSNQPGRSPAHQAGSPADRRRGGALPGAYPSSLEDLLKDPRSLAPVRHLRRLYKDPMTGEDFVVVKDPAGRIKGVRSASEEQPFKEDGFPSVYENFKGAQAYKDWEFVYEPGRPDQSVNTTGGSTVQGLEGVRSLNEQ